MSKKAPYRSRVIYSLKEIEQTVLSTLGKHQNNILTIG